ncbi:MAG: DNA repair exonuclease [Clostridiales bacterium]|nr:DNA repair exonuclease [Clostridiales bacterium]
MKLIHAADLHMDSAFGALPQNSARLRRAEQRGLLKRISELFNAEKADIMLLSGDLLDSERSYAETGEALCAFCADIAAPVFIAPGNHDYYCASSPYARLRFPQNVHIFKNTAIESVALPELNCTVWGAGFSSRSAPPLVTDFKAGGDGFNIMVMHGAAGDPFSDYNPISEADIAASGLDYLALGHVHSYSGIRTSGKTSWAYPGCPEGRGFDETGEKGVIAAQLDESGFTAQFVPLSLRKYEILKTDISGRDALSAVAAALPGETGMDIYRIILTGETESAPDTAALAAALSPRFFSLEIKDETRPAGDQWDGAGDDTLRGLFIKRLRARFEAASDEDERQTAIRALRLGLAALDNRDIL